LKVVRWAAVRVGQRAAAKAGELAELSVVSWVVQLDESRAGDSAARLVAC